MTFSPASSSTTTAGSSALLLTNGAIARTAMPQAETNTSAPQSAKRAPAHSFKLGSMTRSPSRA